MKQFVQIRMPASALTIVYVLRTVLLCLVQCTFVVEVTIIDEQVQRCMKKKKRPECLRHLYKIDTSGHAGTPTIVGVIFSGTNTNDPLKLVTLIYLFNRIFEILNKHACPFFRKQSRIRNVIIMGLLCEKGPNAFFFSRFQIF